jgi:hypothetical protein
MTEGATGGEARTSSTDCSRSPPAPLATRTSSTDSSRSPRPLATRTSSTDSSRSPPAPPCYNHTKRRRIELAR